MAHMTEHHQWTVGNGPRVHRDINNNSNSHPQLNGQQRCCPPDDGSARGGRFHDSPADAQRNGEREKLLFVALPNCATPRQSDAIATIDVDPESARYGKIVSLLELPNSGDELHHYGWNACASCLGNPSCAARRSHLIFPALSSSRIYIVDATNPMELKLHKTIEPDVLFAMGLSYPHTVHCGPESVMISTIGDANYNNEGNFLLLDPATFEPKGKWSERGTKFGYDFWFQPRHNVNVNDWPPTKMSSLLFFTR